MLVDEDGEDPLKLTDATAKKDAQFGSHDASLIKDKGKRIFVFAIRPHLSGNGGSDPQNAFGYYFLDDTNEEETTLREPTLHTIKGLQESGEAHKESAASAAREWVSRNGGAIFETIFNLDHEQDTNVKHAMEFKSVEVEPLHDPYRIHFTMQERRPGAVTTETLVKLRDNVLWGGDTWDCGDFGDVVDTIQNAMLRLSFAHDDKADWIDPTVDPWPPLEKECRDPRDSYSWQRDKTGSPVFDWLLLPFLRLFL